MIYIGSPYSHSDHLVRENRAFEAGRFTVYCLTRGGNTIYCPIAAWHHLAQKFTLPTDFQFWRQQNIGMLRRATELWVLDLDEWWKSVGLTNEIEVARDLYIPTVHFDAKTFKRVE